MKKLNESDKQQLASSPSGTALVPAPAKSVHRVAQFTGDLQPQSGQYNSSEQYAASVSEYKPQLMRALTIQAPVVVQERIAFNELFRLPLSNYFYSIYNQVYQLHTETFFYNDFTSRANYLRDNIRLIDLRPQRWYRTLTDLNENLRVVEQKIDLLSKDITACESELAKFTFKEKYYDKKAEFKELEELHVGFLHQRQALITVLTKLQGEKKAITEEMLTSGYIYEEDKKSNSFIIKKPNKAKTDPPVVLPDKFDVNDTNHWNDFVNKLNKSPAVQSLDSAKLEKYKAQLQAVESRENFIARSEVILALNDQLKRARLDLLSLKASKGAYVSAKDDTNIRKTEKEITKVEEAIQATESQINDIKQNGFVRARMEFILYWNDPKNYNDVKKSSLPDNIEVPRNGNPLAEFYNDVKQLNSGRRKAFQIHRFTYKNADLYNEEQQTLQDFMQLPNLDDQIIIAPYFDANGRPNPEVFQAIIGPKAASGMFAPKAPVIKFVESQEMQMGWTNYALGELAGSFNLFPGEKKVVVVERKTRLTTTRKDERRSDQEHQRNHSSSFDENLRNELTSADNDSRASEHSHGSKVDTADKSFDSSQSAREHAEQDSRSSSFEAKVKAKASFMFGSVSASAGYSTSSSHATQNASRDQHASSKEAARMVSTSHHDQQMSKHSRETSAKNIQNTVSHVASKTSSNNKLSITSSSSEEYEENKTNKEMMMVSNENLGCTVNYNFYQVQNVYRSTIRLKDVKIVVNTGIELVEGTGIYDTRVYELEDFNKIYKDAGRSRMAIVLCALIARRTLKHYTNLFSPQPDNSGILQLKLAVGEKPAEALLSLKKCVDDLNLVALINKDMLDDDKSKSSSASAKKDSEKEARSRQLDIKISRLKQALETLSKFTFVFSEGQIVEESQHQVNAPAYHVDAQIGLNPAVESYMDRRRGLEIEAHEIKNQKARSELGFMQSDPEYRRVLAAASLASTQPNATPVNAVPMLPYVAPTNSFNLFGQPAPSLQPVEIPAVPKTAPPTAAATK